MNRLRLRLLAFSIAVSLPLVLAPAQAFAQDGAPPAPPARIEADADAFCTWARAAASSEAAPLVSPAAFVSGGVVGGPDAGLGASALPPTGRITAGASYSFSGLFRGIAVGGRADAECALYRSEAIIRAFVQAYRDGESKAALSAALAVYQAAEPRAAELFERTQAATAAGRATAVELTEAELRLDDLRTRSARTKRQLDALGKRVIPSPKEFAAALAAQPAREADVEQKLAKIRRTTAWDLSVRGGYDRFFGVRDHVPLFVTGTLTVNVGLLFQPSADDEAIASRRAWASRQIEGPIDRASQATTKLAAARTEARTRFEQTSALTASLEQRHKTLEAVGTDGARVAAGAVWFALVHARAERAFYGALIAELDQALAPISGAT